MFRSWKKHRMQSKYRNRHSTPQEGTVIEIKLTEAQISAIETSGIDMLEDAKEVDQDLFENLSLIKSSWKGDSLVFNSNDLTKMIFAINEVANGQEESSKALTNLSGKIVDASKKIR